MSAVPAPTSTTFPEAPAYVEPGGPDDPDSYTGYNPYAEPVVTTDRQHLFNIVGALVGLAIVGVLLIIGLVIVNTTLRRESTDHRANVSLKVKACQTAADAAATAGTGSPLTKTTFDMTTCLKAIQ